MIEIVLLTLGLIGGLCFISGAIFCFGGWLQPGIAVNLCLIGTAFYGAFVGGSFYRIFLGGGPVTLNFFAASGFGAAALFSLLWAIQSRMEH